MLHQKKKKKKWLTSQDTVFASGTSSKMNWPILPALSKVRCFFDTIKQASKALWGILNAFCSASNCCSIRPSKSLSSSTLLVNSNRVKYKAHWTFVTRSWKGKREKELESVCVYITRIRNNSFANNLLLIKARTSSKY